ncbi:MAG: response regulator transcription factor [Lacunisphaera sp.]
MKPTATKKPPAAARPRRRVLIVDDHPFMRAGLAQLIERQTDLGVAGEAGSPAEALQLLAAGGTDLVLTDMTMPGRSGLDFLKDLQALHPTIPVLVVSMHDEMVYAERALRAGARGYIMKEAGGENLLAAIRQVLGGQVYVSPRMSAQLLDSFSGRKTRDSNSPFGKLTDREFEVFQLIGQGHSTREIAHQLCLSTKTVDVHRGNLKAKLDLKDTTALIRHAVRWVETQGSGD